MTRPQEHLTDEVLAHRLKIAATEPRSYSAAERKQYMIEAALRLEGREIQTPARVVIGHCPQCGGVLVQTNNYGVWEPFDCSACGWQEHPDTGTLINKWRIQEGFIVCPDGEGRYVMRPTQDQQAAPVRHSVIETVKVTSEVL